MEKILVYKGAIDREREIVPVDELCHGLISRARFHQFFARGSDPVIVVPQASVYDLAILWLTEENFPLENCDFVLSRAKEIVWFGSFSKKELQKFQKYPARLQAWDEL